MGTSMRLAVGILGNVTSLFLYAVPTITFRRVLEKKSTEEFSSVPYMISFLNCVLCTLYGTPLISSRSENILVSTVSGVGAILEFCYICIYTLFAPSKTKRNAKRMVVAVLVIFGTVVGISVGGFHSHKSRKMVVGIAAILSSVLMYGSPLSVISLVVRTKSVEFMPFYLSLFSFLSSTLWFLYGVLGRDPYIMKLQAPNILGLPLSIGQLVLYCIYKSKGGQKCDSEMGIKQTEEVQIMAAVAETCLTKITA